MEIPKNGYSHEWESSKKRLEEKNFNLVGMCNFLIDSDEIKLYFWFLICTKKGTPSRKSLELRITH